MISGRRRRAITAGLLLGMALAALEATVVGTAMPTVIATLGGLAHYSWVFAAYLLTSTASVPLWGRLSDLYGRRRLYLAGIFVFIAGSALSGAATTMTQLIVFRAIQGLGAGALIPLSMTIIGELYTLRERARVQALFSSVWGLASIAGPLVGGYVTDALSWRWVFYLNLPFGVLGAVVIALAYPAMAHPASARMDWMGAVLLFSGVTALLIALGGATTAVVPWLAAAAVLLAVFVLVARRTADPILPLDLFRLRIVSRSLAVVFMTGMAMFGAIAFVPLFVQGVMGGTATQAGQVLTPLFLGWVGMSVVGARLTARIDYRIVAVAGNALLLAGFVGARPDRRRRDHDRALRVGVPARLRDGAVDVVAAAGGAARRRALAARTGDIAEPVRPQHRRGGRRGGDGRHPRARARRGEHPDWRAWPAVGGASARRRDARAIRAGADPRLCGGRRDVGHRAGCLLRAAVSGLRA